MYTLIFMQLENFHGLVCPGVQSFRNDTYIVFHIIFKMSLFTNPGPRLISVRIVVHLPCR